MILVYRTGFKGALGRNPQTHTFSVKTALDQSKHLERHTSARPIAFLCPTESSFGESIDGSLVMFGSSAHAGFLRKLIGRGRYTRFQVNYMMAA
jgi:hypothetical protein